MGSLYSLLILKNRFYKLARQKQAGVAANTEYAKNIKQLGVYGRPILRVIDLA